MKTGSVKAKGRRLQKWVQEKLLDLFPEFTDRDIRSTSMGVDGPDIQLSEAASRAIGLGIECKNRASFSVYKPFKQACGHGGLPCLVIKADRERPLVVLDAEHFFSMLRKLHDSGAVK